MFTIAVPDSNVLYPGCLRDTILRAHKAGLYRMQFTDDILEEVRRNLAKKETSEEQALTLISKIRNFFDEGLIPGEAYRPLIPSMPVNQKDRHVLAAAVAGDAKIIITQNLRHFPQKLLTPYRILAQSPDDFLVDLFSAYPESIIDLITKQAGKLRRPPLTVSEVLDKLEIHTPNFVTLVREAFGSQEL